MIQIETGYLASLANSLWLIALESVDLPMQGILRLPILIDIKIKIITGEHYLASK